MKRVWMNGKLAKGGLALSAEDRGLNLGDGLFETFAVADGVALWRFEHLERMAKSAHELGIAFSDEAVENAIDGLTHRAKGHHVLRLTLTRGVAGRGLAGAAGKPTLIGTLQPFDVEMRFKPVKLVTSTIRRNLSSPASHMKTLSYVDQVLAAREAVAKDADDALMLNTAGRLCCTSIGNVFLEREGMLFTPSLSEGLLPGVMRHAVITMARQLEIPVKEKQLRVQDLAAADGMFMTNSLRFIRPVTMCDGRRFSGKSKIVDALMQALLTGVQEQVLLS